MHTSEWWRTTRTKSFTTRRKQSPKDGEAKMTQNTMEMKKQTHKSMDSSSNMNKRIKSAINTIRH
eukprot:8765943-Heterocapsa_arctica.AAC.1